MPLNLSTGHRWVGLLTKALAILIKKKNPNISTASPHVAGAVCYLLSQKRVEPLLVMPQLLGWADKNKLTGLKDRTIDALLVVSDN